MYPDTQLHIAGQWEDSSDGSWTPIVNPATEAVIGRVAFATNDDMERAVQASVEGFEVWRQTPAAERARIIEAAAALLAERVDQIAPLLTQEQGKPLQEARGEILRAADSLTWFAQEGRRVHGRLVPSRTPNAEQLVVREPAGPVAAYTPWNFPINQVIRKLGPALAAGCSIVVKPSEEAPASPAALVQAFVDAGLPPGVIGLLYGDARTVSEYLTAHPAIRVVTITGSIAAGKEVGALALTHMKRTAMELGGHAPVIVAPDADIAAAATLMAQSKYRNAGQVCVSPTRFIIHSSVFDEFAERFVAHAESLRVGDGLDPSTEMGPLANVRRVESLERLIDDAVSHGAQVLTSGSRRLPGDGYFFPPTVIAHAPTSSAMQNEEPFGPVALLSKYDGPEAALAEANRLTMGLAAYVFTNSMTLARNLSREIQAGFVCVNQALDAPAELPFGGTKESGYGSEGGPEALDPYLVVKTVSTRFGSV